MRVQSLPAFETSDQDRLRISERRPGALYPALHTLPQTLTASGHTSRYNAFRLQFEISRRSYVRNPK